MLPAPLQLGDEMSLTDRPNITISAAAFADSVGNHIVDASDLAHLVPHMAKAELENAFKHLEELRKLAAPEHEAAAERLDDNLHDAIYSVKWEAFRLGLRVGGLLEQIRQEFVAPEVTRSKDGAR